MKKAFWLKTVRIGISQTFLIAVFANLTYANNLTAQGLLNQKISLTVENREISIVLQKFEALTKARFIFSPQVIKADQKVSFSFSNERFGSALDKVLLPLQIKYEVADAYILLSDVKAGAPKRIMTDRDATTPPAAETVLAGTVKNAAGNGLSGISIAIKNTARGVVTDDKGEFKLLLLPGTYQLIFSGVGYKKIEKDVVVGEQNITLNIAMQDDNLLLDQVVVTAPGVPRSKLESSVPVTTITSKAIELRPPLNSADLLKAIPGLSVESSGGDGPGSIRVRGLPAGGFVYMGVMEDGTAVMPTGFTTTPSADQFYKVDLTIKNVEAVRGGAAAMLSPSTPGALMNVISNTGGEKFKGKAKYTRGITQNANRIDVNAGGPLAPKWKYNVGGFYRSDEGARPANYTANEGGQLKANLTYEFKPKSYLRFYAKYLNDKAAWLVPSYYSYDGTGRGLALPYFDPLKETLATSDYKMSLTHPNGQTYNFDLSDGVHTKVSSAALEFKYVTGSNWTIKNNMKFQKADQHFANTLVTSPSNFSSTVNYYYLDGTQLGNPTGVYTGQNFTGTTIENTQVTDNLEFSKKVGKHSFSLGANLHTYKIDFLSISSVYATELKNNPRIIKVGTTAGNGFSNVNISAFQRGSETITSAWVNDGLALGNLTMDFGVRADNFNVKGDRLINSAPYNTYTPFNETKLYWTETVGVNYKLNDHNAIFGRATKTYSALNITDYSNFTFNPAAVKDRDVMMAEVGYKINTPKLSVFSSLIYAKLKNVTALMLIPDKNGGFINMSTFASSRNLSAEIEAIYTVSKKLDFRWVTTFQNSKYIDFSVLAPSTARTDLAGKEFSWTGNSPERIPDVISALSGNYTTKYWSLFASYRYIGKRWSSQANLYRMQGYNEVSTGLDINPTKSLAFRVWADNLLNSRGLTEGNIRGDQFLANGDFKIGSPQIGRIILPRSFWASVAFSF